MIPEDKVYRSLYMDKELLEAAKKAAWEQRDSLNSFMIRAIEKAIVESNQEMLAK